MRDKVLSFVKKYHMISPGDHVICALSGGKDSMALLHLLFSLQPQLRFRLSAAHFNHQLRGQEAQRDEEFVTLHCAELGIPLFRGTKDVSAYAKSHSMGLEEAARTLRYEFLLGLSPDAKIATAHNAEDNLETLLMHLIRGTGLKGLSGMRPVRDRIIRPLLLTQRSEIEDYLSLYGIPHVDDSTNETDFCLRNRLRHQVLPAMAAENPSVAVSVSALCLQLSQDENTLTALAEDNLQLAISEHGLSTSFLLELQENMALRVLKLYLAEVPQLQRIHLEQALALCRSTSPSALLYLPGGHILRREYEFLVLSDQTEAPLPESVTLAAGQSCTFGAFHIHCIRGICPELPEDGVFPLNLPESSSVTLRTKCPGDRITLPGGTKKLSRYLMDQKIPSQKRNSLPVVVSEDRVAAILPLATDIHYRAKPGTDSLILSVHRMEEVKNDP